MGVFDKRREELGISSANASNKSSDKTSSEGSAFARRRASLQQDMEKQRQESINKVSTKEISAKEKEGAAIRASFPDVFNPAKQMEAVNNATKPIFGPVAPSGIEMRAAVNKQLPGRDIPVVGPILKGIDKLQEFTQPAAKIAEHVYTPGAGLTAIGGATSAMGSLVSKVAPKVGMGAGILPTIGREAIKEGVVGAQLGAGQSLASNPGGSAKELGMNTLYGGLLGVGGGGLLAGAGKGLNLFTQNAAESALGSQLKTAQAIQKAGDTIPTGPLKLGNNETYINKVMGEIKPIVTERMTPPLENPSELAKWLKPHLGEVSLNDVRKLSYEDMRQLATEVQGKMSMFDIAKQAAREKGYNLDDLLNGKTPNVTEEVDRLRMGRAAGAIDAPQNVKMSLSDGSPMPTTAPKTTELAPSAQPVQRISSSQDAVPVSQVNEVQPAAPIIASRTPTRERGFVSTLRTSDNTDIGVKEGLIQSSNRNYKRITNEETLQSANSRIERLGIDEAEAKLLNKGKFKADDVATGMRLLQQLQDAGETVRAVNIAEKVARQLTEAGQTVQAASIWSRLSPEGALLAAQRKVNSINDNLLNGQKLIRISDTQAADIKDAASAIQASGASKERAGLISEIADRLKKGEDITADERKILSDFISDLKTFIKPTKQPKVPRVPGELSDARVRDRVVSFMDAQEKEALARINARRNTLSSTPFDVWADYAIVGASKIVKGAKSFADWSEQMITSFGDEVKPYLTNIYERSQQHVTQNAKKINAQVVSRAENIAESYIKKNEGVLKDTDIEFIRNAARAVSEQSGDVQRIAAQDLQAIMSSFEKVGVGRKLAAAQYISMLLNPLTQIRNIVGNELMYRAERIARIIGTPVDIAASKITGGPRTITFKSGPTVWEDFFKPAQDYWGKLGEGMKSGWRGVSPEGLTSKYEIQGQAFRSKYNPMTYMEKSLGAALQGFDYAAYTRASNQRMSEMAYLDALNKGIKGDTAIREYMQTYMTNIDEGIHNIAKQYGKFATLQDDSALARGIMGFRRGANKLTTGSPEFGAGSLVVPFAKTPANLLLRGLDYSPAGILKAMKQTYDIVRSKNSDLTRADVIDSVSRSLMGTGMGAISYWLADKGALFGQSNKDVEVRKLMQGTGIKDFQINGSAMMRMIEAIASGGDVDKAAKIKEGDTLWAYQWAQPTSMPMAIGSNVYQSVKDKQGALQTAGEAALAGASTLLDSSLLSGIREAFQIPTGEKNAFKAVAMNLIKQAPSQFVPSLLRQFNTVFDDTARETYATDTAGKILNPAKSNIPILAQQMPQRVDTLGQPQTKLNSFFDVFVSPASRSQYKPTAEAQLVIDLLNETGDNNLAPRAVPKYLSGKDALTGETRKVNLTPKQFVELQTIVGQETANRIKKIPSDWPTDRKITMVLKALDEAGKIGRNKMKQDVGLRKTK